MPDLTSDDDEAAAAGGVGTSSGWGGGANSQQSGRSNGSDSQGAAAAAGSSGGANQRQQRLVRDSRFRAFVLRSCANYLEWCRQQAAHTALLGGAAAGACDWLQLGGALFDLAKVSKCCSFLLECVRMEA